VRQRKDKRFMLAGRGHLGAGTAGPRLPSLLGLGAVGGYLVSLGGGHAFGWTGYAPLTPAAYAPGRGLNAWLRVLIWLVLIGLWAVASVRLLRPSSENGSARK
jgi:hypothetical protein